MPGCWTVEKQRGKNGQSTGSVVEDKPWTKEELKKIGGALRRLKECGLEKVSRLHEANTGVGCDGFHPEVPLDQTKETRGEIVELLEKAD